MVFDSYDTSIVTKLWDKTGNYGWIAPETRDHTPIQKKKNYWLSLRIENGPHTSKRKFQQI